MQAMIRTRSSACFPPRRFTAARSPFFTSQPAVRRCRHLQIVLFTMSQGTRRYQCRRMVSRHSAEVARSRFPADKRFADGEGR